MTNVITDSEDSMNHSMNDYNQFTRELLNDGSKEINTQASDSTASATKNITLHSEEYIKQVHSTTNTLKTTRYDQLIQEQITQNNQEIDEEVSEILAEILH